MPIDYTLKTAKELNALMPSSLSKAFSGFLTFGARHIS